MTMLSIMDRANRGPARAGSRRREGGITNRLRKRLVENGWIRWGVLGLCLLVGLGFTHAFYLAVHQESRARFEAESSAIAHDIEMHIQAYSDVLYAMRGLFGASARVSRDDFHRFASALSLPERYPGLTSISFSFRIRHEEKESFERAIRLETSSLRPALPLFSIKPGGARDEYTVLTYVEPMGDNVAAWGLDLNADPKRRSAVERARDSGKIAAASGVTLTLDRNTDAISTLLRLAVYRGGGVPHTLETRRSEYFGMVGSAVRVQEMIHAALSAPTLARVHLQIFEGDSAAAPGRLLFDSAPQDQTEIGGYAGHAVSQRVRVGDGEWRIAFTPLVDPVGHASRLAVTAMLASALAASILVFWLMRALATSESRATELVRLRDVMHDQAVHDELTGLYNRHYMQEWFALELPRALRHGRTVGAIMLDIDHFKRFNDEFGHKAGDMVLRELAGLIRRLTRKSDVICRYGGEEFVVLLPESPLEATRQAAEHLRREVQEMKLEYEGRSLGTVTISLGVAMYPAHAADDEELLRRADEALYRAKHAGRNRVAVCTRQVSPSGRVMPEEASVARVPAIS